MFTKLEYPWESINFSNSQKELNDWFSHLIVDNNVTVKIQNVLNNQYILHIQSILKMNPKHSKNLIQTIQDLLD